MRRRSSAPSQPPARTDAAMDLPVWLMLVAILLPAICAGPADKGPQIFNKESKATSDPKVQKREQKYEMKEVILYLTPTQIRALEAGEAVIEHQGLQQQAQAQLQTTPKPDIAATTQTKENVQNLLHNQGQKMDKEIKKLETMKQQRMQLQESIKNIAKTKDLEKIAPENNAPPSPQLDLQKREKYIDLPLGLDLPPPPQAPQEAQQEELSQLSHLEQPTLPTHIPNLEQLIKSGDNYFTYQPQIPSTPAQYLYENFKQQFENYSPLQGNIQKSPQNYAYLYFYPRGKPFNFGKYNLFYPDSQGQKQKELQSEQEQKSKELELQQEGKPNIMYLPPHEKPQEPSYPQPKKPSTFYLPSNQKQVSQQEGKTLNAYYLAAEHKPKNLVFQSEHFTKPLFLDSIPKTQDPEQGHKEVFLQPEQISKELYSQLAQQSHTPELILQQEHNFGHLLPQHKFPLFNLGPNFQLIPYEYGSQDKLEAQQILQAQLNEHELAPHRLQEYKLEPHQLEDINTQEILFQKTLEPQYSQYEALKPEIQDAEKVTEVKSESSVSLPQLKEEDLKSFHPAHQEKLKEVMEAQKELVKLEKEEQEAQRLDAELEAEQKKAEQFKEEQRKEQLAKQEQIEYPFSLDYLMKLEPKRTQMHSILKPLFQGHNIAESLQQQKQSFPHHTIQLENGFKPLQYAPKFNEEKYSKEVENILRRNHLEKQKAIAKAVAIANEPPEIIKSEGAHSFEIIKHVNVPVPTPVMVPVPHPIEVKVPQPYPVPMEIIRPVPIPIVKTEKVEVERPVPIQIEKQVPVPLTKNVYVKIDKPYIIEKNLPMEVSKQIPVRKPYRPQKFSIIKHVWES